MSSDVAVRVEDLGKCYEIYAKPSHRLKQMLMGGKRQYFREFWALKNVSFEIRKGETVGIIGRNGSGKSTLLQLICGTLNPTLGQITSHGRVAALLELGSGFNPEFTGRENVYLNASVLGLTKEEIDSRYEDIVAFADIGDFINEPVKSYSSGMYVRLAFAVIAHVNADILIIDEALAVGDAVFTQKCMRFIRKFKENGSLLFVSHDMSSVLSLCERAVWLHQGQIREIGESKTIAESYLQYTLQEVYGEEARLSRVGKDKPSTSPSSPTTLDYQAQMQVSDNLNEANGWKTGAGEIVSVRLLRVVDGGEHEDSPIFKGGERVRMTVCAAIYETLQRPILGFIVRDRLGQDLFGENTLPFTTAIPTAASAGEALRADFTFNLPMLPNGQYSVMVSLADGDLGQHVQHHWLHDALILNVSSSMVRWGLVGLRFDDVTLQIDK